MSSTVTLLKTSAITAITADLTAAVASSASAASSSASAASSSASAASSSATAAASSAASASSSAASAANAIANTYKGGVAGGSVPATSALAGDYYRITAEGTAQSKTWAAGDLAIYNGTSGSWTQIVGYNVDLATLAAQRNALAPAQALSFNGTAGGTIANTQAFGTGDYSVSLVINPSSLATASYLYQAAADNGSAVLRTNGSVEFYSSSSGPKIPNGSITAGTSAHITYVRASGVGYAYLNGVQVATGADAGNCANAITALGQSVSLSSRFTGTLRLLGITNRALSAAEVLAVYQTGSFPASDYGASGAPAGTTVTAGAFVIGKKYRIVSVGTTSFTGIGASANTVGVEFTATGVGTGTGTALVIGLLVAPDPAQPGNGLTWGDRSGNGAHILLPTSGVDWLLPSAAVNKLRGTTSTSGNQQLLGGTTLNANTQITRVRARSRSGTPSITLGTAIGESQIVASVALSTTWKDLTIALTGGIISTASSVWVGSSTADVVEIDLTHEPLGY